MKREYVITALENAGWTRDPRHSHTDIYRHPNSFLELDVRAQVVNGYDGEARRKVLCLSRAQIVIDDGWLRAGQVGFKMWVDAP